MRQWSLVLALGVLFLATGCAKPPATMEEANQAQAPEAAWLVERARITVEAFAADPQFGEDFRNLARRARGLLIAPSVYRGAVILGAAGGSGVAVARDTRAARWNGPAFYTLGEVSFGLQIGADASEIVLLAMTERGVNAMLSPSFKLGGDVSVAIGPVGAGLAAATMNLSADILSYSRAKGLYAGLSLQGAVVATRHSWNSAYYRRDIMPVDILIRGDARDPSAEPLLAALEKAAAP